MKTKRIDLFNGQSFIELVDFAAMGNKGEHLGDWAVVDGARVSFGRESSEFSFEKNRELAGYLWDASDASPFDQFIMQFRVRIPIHIALEWFLFPHASYNEISGRYTKAISETERCFVPPDFSVDLAELLRSDFEQGQQMYKRFYSPRKFEAGEKQVAKELARAVLLFTFSTEFIFTISLRKLAHFMMFFGANSVFQPINEVFLNFIQNHAPIFSEIFEPQWSAVTKEKSLKKEASEIPFADDETGILDDEFSALKLMKARGSDEELAHTLRFSRGCSGGNAEVIKSVLRGCKKDDLPPELSEIGLSLAIRCPVYIFRQMYRHKRAMWYGLQIIPDHFYIPQQWRAQTKGSRYVFEPFGEKENTELTEVFSEYIEERRDRCAELLLDGVSIEQTERFTPYCFYIQVLRNSDGIELFNFLNLRCDWHAQLEHQRYALRVAEIFAERFPLTFISWYEEYWSGQNEKVDELYQRTKS
ncbi:FAD-dependent thymidylate synthase [Patescibacteria group bacterium]|nr:FAD-dependent thymidylate synthase [Patescibacteria group bacterium]